VAGWGNLIFIKAPILVMSKNILAIHDGHTATAAIIRDGKVLACISEERLNRVKEWGGVPALAVREVMRVAGVQPGDVDSVVVPSLINPITSMEAGRRSLPRRVFGQSSKLVPKGVLRSDRWVGPAVGFLRRFRHTEDIRKVLRDAGIEREPVFCEHHLAHAATAHYPRWFRKSRTLVITADGSGDAVSASINIGDGPDIERVLNISNYNSLGELYSRVTEFLGMKPLSHEYKVMGLAPYSKEEHVQRACNEFRKMVRISPRNPLVFENTSGVWKWQYLQRLQSVFERERFDNIAGGLQKFLEEIMVKWVGNVMEHYDIHDICLAGGLFMNVKANQRILEMPGVENLFVMPSCGDESLAIGAGLWQYVQMCREDGIKPVIEPLGPLYMGPEYTGDEIEGAISESGLRRKCRIEKVGDIDGHVGERVAKGDVVARFSGRCEWGARALGNRSILADARNRDVVMKINEAVKNRDFWMPFAPSIMKERAGDYIENPKGFPAPYMIISFNTTERGREALRAALHQYDFTARPQVVESSWNPGYHRVLKAFEEETGEGGFLNTSFNLHGYPIVCSPRDAIRTLEVTGLENLALGDWFISKK
jgi:carbamoyltransferase